jgi:transposase
MEIITGIERRRRWRVEDKLRIVAETEQPGAGFAEIARRHEVSRGLLWNWRSQVRRGRLIGSSASSFLPARVVNETAAPDPQPQLQRHPSPEAAAAAAGRIEITLPDGSHVQVDNTVSLAALRRVVTALRG